MHRRNATVLIALALAIALSAAWMPSTAVPRQCVILEGMTQWNCPPCATWNPQERTVLQQMTRDTVISIKYHAWWPGANNDIFHLWNVAENTARINMYGVDGVPASFLDGATQSQTQAALRNSVRTHFAQNCPCTISIFAWPQGETSVSYAGTITAETAVTGLRLYVALITDEEHAPPQGSNGETMWDDVFRDMSPNANQGVTLAAGAGQSENFFGTLNCNADWDIENMHVVAFVQNSGTRQIVQGTHAPVEVLNYGMISSSNEPYQRIIDPADEEFTYTVNIQNIGLQDDTYDVELAAEFPEGWTHTIEAPGVTPSETQIQVSLSNLETAVVTVRLNSHGYPGAVPFGVNVSSPNAPMFSSSYYYYLMGGMDILVVDDDEGESFEDYFLDAIAPYANANNLVAGMWDVNLDFLDNSFINDYDIVVWLTGSSLSDGETLSAMDQLMLSDYLTSGGSLFLSGQGIGFDIRTDQFLSDYLHCGYDRNYPQGTSLTATAGDPISDGLNLSLTGGSGAGGQSHQSAIHPLDDAAVAIYMYNGSNYYGAVRVVAPATPAGSFGIVYLGFGFEAISEETTRLTLMARSLDWLYGVQPADETPPVAPLTFELGQNFPNPFNPETTIPFTLAERSMVTLNVYDILGREVSQLVSGIQDAGRHSVNWNAETVSSGIYFYTLEATAGDQTFRSARKLVLMK